METKINKNISVLYKKNAFSPLIGQKVKYTGGIPNKRGYDNNFEVGKYYTIDFSPYCKNTSCTSKYDLENLCVLFDERIGLGYVLNEDNFDVEELVNKLLNKKQND